ncbi:F-box protein [Cardamine amara subsp. amara]|uniref:F-box protein n=1 Tax=Cardamine amara subsp. amara TaxID=228776 RepID=A0ABD0ZC86_CARAN
MTDWSHLPTDLVELIVGCLETLFEIIHFRSDCTWPSIVPPLDNFCCLGFKTPNIPYTFNDEPRHAKFDYCKLEKIPIFLLRFKTPFCSDDFLAEIRGRKAE